MDYTKHLRQEIRGVFSVVLLAGLFGLTAVTQFDRIFVFCAAAGVFLILNYSYDVLAEHRAASVSLLLLTAVSGAALVLLSGRLISFLFLSFALPAMRGEAGISIFEKLFRILMMPVFFAGCILTGLFRVEREEGFLLAFLFLVFSLTVFFVDDRLLAAENRRRRERLLLEKSVAEAVAERERRYSLTQNQALLALRARQEEREQISRNIHNEVGHSITASLVALEAADILLDRDPEHAREKIRTACDRMRDSLSGIRKAVRVMDASPNVCVSDLIDRLQADSERFTRDTDAVVRFHAEKTDPKVRLSAEHADFLSGAVLELFSNGLRHGGATAFVSTAIFDTSGIRLTIEDNGQGAASKDAGDDGRTAAEDGSRETNAPSFRPGFGLTNIRSYVEKNGGSLMIASGAGFRVSLDLPVAWETEEV